MENKTNQINSTHWAMFMFLSLSQQSEGWAYILKDKMKMREKQILNHYLAASKTLFNLFSEKSELFDELIENSTVWSDLMKLMIDLPLNKQQALYTAMVEFINGNIIIQDPDGNITVQKI